MKPKRPGFVLVAVLAGLLLVAAISFALLFTTTLDTLAARSAQRAVSEEAQLQGALDLALALLVSAAVSGETHDPAPDLGPWPEYGLAVRVSLVDLADDEEGNAVVRLEARQPGGNGRAPALLVARLGAEPLVLWRP